MSDALENPPVDSLTRLTLRQYANGLHLKYSEGTIGPIVGDIRQFCRWMKRRHYTEKNLGKRLKTPPQRWKKSKAAPEQCIQQVAELLAHRLASVVWRDLFSQLVLAPRPQWDYGQSQAARDLFVLLFLYETGARAGEVVNLSYHAMTRALAVGGPVYNIACVGKTQSEYWFTPATANAWLIWQHVRPAAANDHAVIGWRRRQAPEPLTTNAISNMLVRRCRECGIEPVFRAHALRHSKISRTRKLVGLETACILIDHANPVTTFGYANVEQDEITDAVLRTGWQVPLF